MFFSIILMLAMRPHLLADTGTSQSAAGALTAMPPAAPGLTSPADGASAVTLPAVVEWDSLAHATTYTLQVSDADDFSNLLVNESGLIDTSYSVSGLAQGGAYYWHVCAGNTAGDGGFCEYNTFTAEGSLPVELSSFSAEPVSAGVLLKWTTQSETDNLGFILERQVVETLHATSPQSWETIASYLTHPELRAHGNTSQRTDYSFMDENVQPGQSYTYRLSDVNTSGEVHVYDEIQITLADAPEMTAIDPPFPNPFNPQTKIEYHLAKSGPVEIMVYDILGRKVKSLLNETQRAGSYNIWWHGRDNAGSQTSTGTYLIMLKTKEVVRTQKVVMVR